jgi:enoyl-CoA hydratase/carnithine racemase
LGIKRANELALLGDPISAETALQWGIVNRLVQQEAEVLPASLELARAIIKGSPEAVEASLKGIRRGYSTSSESLRQATITGAREEGRRVSQMDNIGEGMSCF